VVIIDVSERIAAPGVHVLFSTRRGGFSEGPYASMNLGILSDDDPDRVRRNRRRFADTAGIAAERIAMGWQVHGSEIKDWEAPPEHSGFARAGAELARVDGHVTSLVSVGLLVLVADCLPVALASSGRIAMLHCGWRGLAGGIIERALASFDEPPQSVIGPGIGPECYEVGDEVLAEFAGLDGAVQGRRLDLRAVARAQLAASGVQDVIELKACTSCEEDSFFSHRRDRGVTGRQAGLIWREP
jgi:YfiH family protein